MTDAELAALAEAAERATPGPWVAAPKEARFGAQVNSAGSTIARYMECERAQDNAAYITAANPDAIRRLLARLRAAEMVCEAAYALMSNVGEIRTRAQTYYEPAKYVPTHEAADENALATALKEWKDA
ncbi:MAG: hypothetical protein EBR82_31965 [Caulobacteraceae bacterium]|nr:hypothetical protein [Caulobacteraceae bacterium]